MTKPFNLRAFLLDGGVIYAKRQDQWISVHEALEENGFDIGYKYRELRHGAVDFPWIAYDRNHASAFSDRWEGLKTRESRITYDELRDRLNGAELGPPAQPDEILSMLYKEASV